MAYYISAQSETFSLLRIYHSASAHFPLIYLVQIDQLFHHWESSKYLITVHRRIVWKLQIAYLEIFRRFIWLLRKAQFFVTAHHTIILLLLISQIFVYCKSTNYFNTGNRLHIWLLCIENCMTTSNRIFRNISTIYMATVKGPIFRLLRNYSFPTANIPILYLLQIEQLFQHWKSSKYFNILHWKTVWKLHIACLVTFRRSMSAAQYTIFRMLRIYDFATAHFPFIYDCKSTNYFMTGNRLHKWILCIEKLYEYFNSPTWKHFEHLYGYCAKPHFLANAHHKIIFLLRISQLYVYCKSTNHFTNANRLNICLQCLEKLYDISKLPIWKRFNNLCGYCAKPNLFATAHLSFCYCASPNY